MNIIYFIINFCVKAFFSYFIIYRFLVVFVYFFSFTSSTLQLRCCASCSSQYFTRTMKEAFVIDIVIGNVGKNYKLPKVIRLGETYRTTRHKPQKRWQSRRMGVGLNEGVRCRPKARWEPGCTYGLWLWMKKIIFRFYYMISFVFCYSSFFPFL